MSTIGDNKDTLKFAGDFQLDVCTLISYRKSSEAQDKAIRINVLPQVLTISYVEDITLQCISGEIVLSDVQDIRTSLPLTGMERLELKFYTPGSDISDRVEAIEETSVVVTGLKIERILQGIKMLENQTTGKKRNINLVSDYNISNVSLKVERIILSHIDFVNRVVWQKES